MQPDFTADLVGNGGLCRQFIALPGGAQATMIGYGLWRGAHLHPWQVVGLVAALGGLTGLVLPGLAAPPLSGALLMVGAGIAWGIYSLRGRQTGDPTTVTAGNFLKSVPLAAALSLIALVMATRNP